LQFELIIKTIARMKDVGVQSDWGPCSDKTLQWHFDAAKIWKKSHHMLA